MKYPNTKNMEKRFNLDEKGFIAKSIAYKRNRGKKLSVIVDGEKTTYEVKKGFKGLVDFVLSGSKGKEAEKEEKNKANQNNNKKNNNKDNTQDKLKQSTFQIAQEDEDEYIPQDFEFGESMKDGPRSYEIYPALYPEYFNGGKKSFFNTRKLIWNKKKKLRELSVNIDKTKNKHNFSGFIGKGIFSIPLPEGALPDIDTLSSDNRGLEFKVDQNNCIYIESTLETIFSFDFYLDQIENNTPPVKQDSQNIIKGKLTDKTSSLLDKIEGQNLPTIEKARILENYIKVTKKYNEEAQGKLFKSSSYKNYFFNLDNSDIVECYSSNTLFVGLCRMIGIPSRTVFGHAVQNIGSNGKTNIGRNTGHVWSEIWDDVTKSWIRFDATPIEKDDSSDNNNSDLSGSGNDESKKPKSGGNKNDKENKENGKQGEKGETSDNKNGNSNSEESGDNQPEGNSREKQSNNGNDQNVNGKTCNNSKGNQENKTAKERLKEIISDIENDSLATQKDKLEELLNKTHQTDSKDGLKNIKDESELSRKAKEILESAIEEKILEQERADLSKAKDEDEITKILEESYLNDPSLQNLLNQYGEVIKRKIEEERARRLAKMINFGFSEEDIKMFDQYLTLEAEVKNDIKRNIRDLEKLLPKKYRIVEKEGFKRGKIDKQKLKKHFISGETDIFTKRVDEVEDITVNMFETIIIDRSGSMGDIEDEHSPIREAVKAAIIRAKTLEYFKVEFSIVIFDEEIEEVMSFGENFSSTKTLIPAKLMKSLQESGFTDVSKPLIHTRQSMKEYSKRQRKKGVGNITFIGDGEPTHGLTDRELVSLINDLRRDFSITAFYINSGGQNGDELEKYFGSRKSGGTVVIPSVKDLSKGIISTFNKNLKRTLRKIERLDNK